MLRIAAIWLKLFQIAMIILRYNLNLVDLIFSTLLYVKYIPYYFSASVNIEYGSKYGSKSFYLVYGT